MEKPIKGFRIEFKGVYREKEERGGGEGGRGEVGGDKQEGSLQNPKCFVALTHTA